MTWTRLDNEKPLISEYYLVIQEECSPSVLFYSKEYDYWQMNSGDEIIWWHPLPRPPKEE